MRSKFSKFFILLAVLLGILTIPFFTEAIDSDIAHPFTEQKTFNLDFDQKTFQYEQRQLNETGYPYSYIYTYYGASNQTFWIQIPKNSTVSNSTLMLTGLILVNRTNIGENLQIRDIDIGDITSDSGNEISITIQSSSYNIRLYDGRKNLLWQNTSTEDVYDSEIDNITLDSNNEVVIGTEDGLEVLDENGIKILQYNIGLIFSLSVGNVTTDSGNEIAAGGTNLYLLNSSLELIENDSSITTGDIKGVYIGDVTAFSPGNEIVIGTSGTETKIYLLNYTTNFNKIWDYEAVDDIDDVFIGNISTDAGNEIVVVTSATDDKVYALNSTGHSLWNYSLEDDGRSIIIGEFADISPGNEVIVGTGSGNVEKIYILNSTGGSILNYTTDMRIRGVTIGNVTADTENNINEILAVTTNGSLYELNYDAFPTNVTLNAGDGPVDWNYTGKFRTSEILDDTDNLTIAIQSFLDGCSEEVCVVPFTAYSAGKGRLQVSDINISYYYNASTDVHNVSITSPQEAWAKTQNTKVNQSIVKEAINVSYTDPNLNISIREMKINSGATACGFQDEEYPVLTSYKNGDDYCNVSDKGILIIPGQSPYSYHLLWDDKMAKGTPIILNESDPYNTSTTDNYLWIKNLTIWSNATQQSFTNIIANVSLNDTIVKGDAFLNVTWDNTKYDITPSTQCPNMEDMGNGFYACWNDTDDDTIRDFFNWTQPNASAGNITFYQAGGTRNLLPNITSPNVDPSSGLWGQYFNFSALAEDDENNEINVTLWIYTNFTNTWVRKESQNTSLSSTVSFNISSNKDWVGTDWYKFEYFDYNASNPSQKYHSPRNISGNYSGPVVQIHNVSLEHIEGNDTNVSREYGNTNTNLTVYLNDSTGYENWTDTSCMFWITLDGNVTDWGHSESVNSSGYSNHSFNPNGSYSVGLQNWTVTLNENFYNLTNKENYTLRVKGHLNVSLSQPQATQNVIRNHSLTFEGLLLDEYGNTIDNSSINTSDYTCNFYFNNTNMGSDPVNSSGQCNYTWTPNCTYEILDQYYVNVTLTDVDSLNYTIIDNESHNQVNLVDYPIIFITDPLTGSSFFKGTQIDLNATVNDTCDTCDNNSYQMIWYINYPYVIVNLNETEGINRSNEPVTISGQEMEQVGANLTKWKANDTKITCDGISAPVQVISSGEYLNTNSEIIFLINLTSGNNKTCFILHNDTFENTTLNYIKNGGFESGDETNWNCEPCVKDYCNCTVTQEGTEENGNYSILLSAEYGLSKVSQTLDHLLSSEYIKIKLKTWGEYDSGAYIRLSAGSGTCELTPNSSDVAYGSAEWNTTVCHNVSFSGATSVNVSVYDVGDGGGGIDASHLYIDYICIADSLGNCITFDSGASLKSLTGRENITTSLINSTEGQWSIPINHNVGPYTIFSSMSGDYYLTNESESYIDVFGLANVSYFNFTPVVEGECQGNLCFTGADLILTCGVIDKNNSQGIYNFTTNFYNDSTNVGSEQTNKSGYAEFIWINSTEYDGWHDIKCNISDSPNLYYNVTENEMNFSINFASDDTNGTMNITSPTYDVVYNLTKQNNDTVMFDITANNTGTGNMFGIFIEIYNKTGIEGTTDLCSYLANGTTCSGNVTFEVSRFAALGNNSINISMQWSNPDPVGPGFENKTIVINVTPNTAINAVEESLNYTVPYGSTSYSSLIIEDFGNTGLDNISFSLSGGNTSLIYSWIGINGTAINQTSISVAKNMQNMTNISMTVPNNSTYMDNSYWAYLYANETGFSCNDPNDCGDLLLINITVIQQDWTLDPVEDDMKIAGINSNTNGVFTLINLTNHKFYDTTINTSQTVTNSTGHDRGSEYFNITLNNGTIMPLPQSFLLEAFSSVYLNISYNVSGASENDTDTYYLNLSLESQNSSTVPVWINISRSLMISNFAVDIINPTQTIQTNPVNVGDTITIYANATLGQSQHLNESVEWLVWVGGVDCKDIIYTSNTTGAAYTCDWIINCTAPEITGNPLNNTLKLSGNYTILPIDFNDTETNAVLYNDSAAPKIWTIEIIPEGRSSATEVDGDKNVHYTLESGNLTIRVNITENNDTSAAWLAITNPNSMTTEYNLTKIGNYWEYNYTDLGIIGDYEVVVHAKDYNNNYNNTENYTTGYFDVYENMSFISNFTDWSGNPLTVNLSFFRPGTLWKISENTSDYTEFKVHKRNYDIKVEVWGHTVIFQDADLNDSSQSQFNESNPENITNPFRFDHFSDYTYPQINIMPSKFEDPIMGLVIEPDNLSSSGGADITANITINYSDALQAALNGGKSINTQNLEILECSNWNYATRECTGGLSNSDYIDVNSSGGIVNFQATLHSAYIVAEGCYAGTSLIDCSGYEEPPPSPGGGSSGSNDEEAEVTTFTIDTNLGSLTLYQGESKDYWLYITNNLQKQINPKISMTGDLSRFLSFSETDFIIEAGKSKRIAVSVSIPDTTKEDLYSGNVVVEAEGEKDEIPVVIKIVSKSEGMLSLDVSIIKKRLEIEEMLKFQVKMRNLGTEKELKPTLTYLIKDGTDDKIVKEVKENVTLEKMLSFTKRIELNDTGLEEGEHILEVWAEVDGSTVNDMESFEVIKPFLATTLGVTLIYTLLILSIVIATIFIRKYYVSWKVGKEAKKRYLFPVDMSKVPQKTEKAFWIGTIAGSKIKSWLNPDDLTTHVLVAGATGSGKSVGASIIVEEALAQKIPVIVFDPTAQWTGFVRGCKDNNLLNKYPKFGMDLREIRSYKGMIFELTDPKQKIEFKEFMNPGEITVFNLNKLKSEEFDDAVRNIINSMFRVNWEESTTIKMIVVFDEVHRLLEKYGGKGGYIALEKACREFRKWGISIIMCSQVLADFKAAVSGNVLTDIQLNTKSLEDLKKARDKYGETYAKRITRQGVGVGMIHNPKYNDGKPYFVQFRPTYHNPHKITNEELEKYKQFATELKTIKKKLEEMEKSGKEMFDLKLELKLAEDKLKLGNFRMANIYITSLKKHLSGGA